MRFAIFAGALIVAEMINPEHFASANQAFYALVAVVVLIMDIFELFTREA